MKSKKITRCILAVIGILLIANAVFLCTIGNVHFGIIIVLAIGALCVAGSLLFNTIENYFRNGALKWIKRIVTVGLCLTVLCCAFLGVYGRSDNCDYTEDAVIVLGAGVKGEVVTNTLAYRLDKAVEYSKKNKDAVIIVSGGKGNGELITEAEAMERYMIKRGVAEERIVKESKATSTHENFLYSKQILDNIKGQNYRIVYITNSFHIFRAGLVARQTGFDATHMHAEINWYDAIVNYIRELFAIAKYVVMGK